MLDMLDSLLRGPAESWNWFYTLLGGLGYSERKLREIFSGFSSREIREMEDRRQSSNVFGVPGLLTALFQKET